jgi:tetratricopeptide (TPR) repeat protein
MSNPLHDDIQRARALHQRGMLADAETIYQSVLRRQPGNHEVLHLAGLLAVQAGRAEQGVALIGKALRVNGRSAAAHTDLGAALGSLRRYADALASHDRAIALKPDYAKAHYNRGLALANLRRPADALASFDQAIALKPDYAEAHCNRAVLLAELGRPADALASHDRAIALKPDYVRAYYNRGVVLADLHRHTEALASYDRTIALSPDHADAYANRGVVLAYLLRHEEALESCDRAIALRPDDAAAHANRGVVLADMQRHEQALASYDRAIALRPEWAEAHRNQSHSWLALGHLERGWHLHEWRKRCDRPAGNRAFPQPVWLGQESIEGKRLFIHREQGLGDTIQFCRYALLAQARGARVVMSAQGPLRRLLGTLGPDIEVIGSDEVPGDFDCHCPMMSLPLAFGTTLETIPHPTRYLAADPATVAAWRRRLALLPGLRVGLCWAGNPRPDQPSAHLIDRRRSTALAQYAPLAQVAGACFVSLQKGEPAAQAAGARLPLHDWTDALDDFADTAALIEALDLVITVDTSVAHLAGALGKPVWILNRFDSCWRWFLYRYDSPWYASARLFRQPAHGDWDSVIAAVAAALREAADSVPGGVHDRAVGA